MKINLKNAVIEKVQTMADGSIQLRIGMPQLPPEEMTQIFGVLNKDVVTVEADVEEWQKSPSKLLHDRMAVYYKKKISEDMKGWDEWYQNSMRKIGQQYLDKLDRIE